MANLTFKKGLYSSDMFGTLSGSGIKNFAEGTVYITTDEQSMYVDTYDSAGTAAANQKRIRIQGAVQVYNSIEEFTDSVEPPYSSDVIYFIADKNALVHHDGTKWVHLNATVDQFLTLQNAVNSNASAIAQNAKDIATNKEAIDGNDKDIAALAGRMDAAESDIDKLEATTTNHETRLTAAEGTIDSQGTKIKSLETTVVQHTTDIASKASQTALETLETEVGKKANQADLTTLENTVNGINTKLTTVESQSNTNKSDIAKLNTSLSTLNTTVSGHTTSINNLKDQLDATNETISGLNADLDTAEGKITNLENSLITTNSNVTNITGRVESLETTVPSLATKDELASEKAELNNLITANKEDIAANKEAIDSNDKDIAALQEAIGTGENGLATRVSKLETDLGTAQTDIGKNAAQITKNKDDIAANTAAIATKANQSDLTKLQTEVETKASQADLNTLSSKVTDNTNDISSLNTALTSYKTEVSTTYATKGELTTAKTELTDLINDEILAVNAMTYQDGVAKEADLPTSGVSRGDTYIVTTAFPMDGDTYYPGDIIIATGEENEEGTLDSITWVHVESGYIKENDPKLDSVVKTSNKSVTTRLTSLGGTSTSKGDLGEFTLESANENLTISLSGSTITVNSVWGSF